MSRGVHCKFRIGDRVYDAVDPRHVGEITRLTGGVLALIKWEATDQYSELPTRLPQAIHGATNMIELALIILFFVLLIGIFRRTGRVPKPPTQPRYGDMPEFILDHINRLIY